MSVYSKLQSLLTAANGVTGESDTTLTEGVQHLANGFMQRTVRFYDYTGEALGSAPSASLASLPEPPVHSGLTFLGWSKSISAIQAFPGDVCVHARFKPTDGKTRIYMTLSGSSLSPTLYFSQDKANGLAIDWGDGSEPVRLSGTGVVNATHTYGSQGDYVITLTADADCTWSPGSGTTNTSQTFTGSYKTQVTAVEFGNGVNTIPKYALYGYSGLQRVLMPDGITWINAYSFYGCGAEHILIPDTVIGIDDVAFGWSGKLKSIVIPESVESIGSWIFKRCQNLENAIVNCSAAIINNELFSLVGIKLKSVTISDRVQSIGDGMFDSCSGLTRISTKARIYIHNCFNKCTGMESIELGGIGRAVTSMDKTAFGNWTQTCDITIYTMPQYVTTLINNARNGAINATIIIKASNDAVYNGVSYSAGDTIVTSNP